MAVDDLINSMRESPKLPKSPLLVAHDASTKDQHSINPEIDVLQSSNMELDAVYLVKIEAAAENKHIANEQEMENLQLQEESASSDGESSGASQESKRGKRRKVSSNNPFASRESSSKVDLGDDINETKKGNHADITEAGNSKVIEDVPSDNVNGDMCITEGYEKVENTASGDYSSSGDKNNQPLSSSSLPISSSSLIQQQQEQEKKVGKQQVDISSTSSERKELKQGKRGIFFEPTGEVQSMVTVLLSVAGNLDYTSVQKKIDAMPLPDGWIRRRTSDDKEFFWDQKSAQTSKTNPHLMFLHRMAKQKSKASKKFQGAFMKLKSLKAVGALGVLKTASASSSMSTSAIAQEVISEDQEEPFWNHQSAKKALVVPDIRSRVSSKTSRKRVSVKSLLSDRV